MEICIGKHCYYIPIIVWPWHSPFPGPGPVNDPYLIQDAILIASLHDMANKVSDAGGVREPLIKGIHLAIQALQKRGGEGVKINMQGATGGQRG